MNVQSERPSAADAPPTIPAISRHEFSTAAKTEANEFIRAVYAQHSSEYSGVDDDFHFEAGYVQNSTFGIEYLAASGTGRIRLQPLRSLLIVNVTGGRAEIRTGDVHEDVWPGEYVLLGANVDLEIQWDEVRVSIIRLEIAALGPMVATLDGRQRIDPALGVVRPVGALQTAHLRATIEHLKRDVLPNSAAAKSGLVRRQAFWSLAAALVNTFPGALVPDDELPRATSASASAIVRRACAFIDTHAQERITTGQISRAAFVSPRTLQDAFRKHLSSTPTEYLTRVRLQGAYDDLTRMSKQHGDTVATVARKWRFANGGRFAKLYREQFGVTPHQTLES